MTLLTKRGCLLAAASVVVLSGTPRSWRHCQRRRQSLRVGPDCRGYGPPGLRLPGRRLRGTWATSRPPSTTPRSRSIPDTSPIVAASPRPPARQRTRPWSKRRTARCCTTSRPSPRNSLTLRGVVGDHRGRPRQGSRTGCRPGGRRPDCRAAGQRRRACTGRHDLGLPTPHARAGVWWLTPPAFAAPQTPWLGGVTPFLVDDVERFRPDGPPSLHSFEWVEECMTK